MAKWIGNDGVPDTYPSARLPSTTSTERTTTNFPADRVTHMHHSPKGEGLSQSERQFRQSSYAKEKEGAPLNRAVPRQYANGRDADGAATFGRVGSGESGKTSGNPYAGSGNRSFKSESFSDSDDDSFSRRYGSSGLGKSG